LAEKKDKKKSQAVTQDQELDVEKVQMRLDMFDQRLDNIDSIVTAVAERLMSQPVTLNITCPHCGSNMEIAIIGNPKPKK